MSLRDLAADAVPFSDICTSEECLGCGRVSIHSQEGADALALISLAPELALLAADMAAEIDSDAFLSGGWQTPRVKRLEELLARFRDLDERAT